MIEDCREKEFKQRYLISNDIIDALLLTNGAMKRHLPFDFIPYVYKLPLMSLLNSNNICGNNNYFVEFTCYRSFYRVPTLFQLNLIL